MKQILFAALTLMTATGFGQDSPETRSVDVSGLVIDTKGTPISNAQVFVHTQDGVTETATDARGHYELKDLRLPVQALEGPVTAMALLRVVAIAPKYAVGSSGEKFLVEVAANVRGFPSNEQMKEFGEPVVANVTLSTEQRLGGRITDSDGNPIANVRITLQSSTVIPDDSSYAKEQDFVTYGSNTTPVGQIEQLSRLCIAMTDENGTFELPHTAANSRLRIKIEAPGYPEFKAYGLTTSWNPIEFEPEILILRSNKTLKLPPLVEITVAVVLNDTEEPARDICVYARSPQVSTHEITDINGKVTLRVPPGKYSIAAYPNTREPYFHRTRTVVVSQDQKPTVLRLDRGVTVYAQFVREDTGDGVRNLLVKVDGHHYFHRTHTNGQLQSSRGLTSGNGTARLLLRPGSRRVSVTPSGGFRSKRTTLDVQVGKQQRIKIPVSQSPAR